VARAEQCVDQLDPQARCRGGVSGGKLGIDQVAHRDGCIAATLAIQRHQAIAATQRLRRIAAHAREPLRGLGPPHLALRRP
jgi:hypothetical protein